MAGILECPVEIWGMQGHFAKQVKDRLAQLLAHCRKQVGLLKQGYDIKRLLEVLYDIAGAGGGGGKGIADLAFLEFLREQVRELKLGHEPRAWKLATVYERAEKVGEALYYWDRAALLGDVTGKMRSMQLRNKKIAPVQPADLKDRKG